MDWLTDGLGLLANAASGGVFGLLGSLIGVGAKWLQEKQRQSWQREVWQQEARLQEMQMRARAQETEQELAIAAAETDAAVRQASYRHAMPARSESPWAANLRTAFRPLLTTALVVCTVVIFFRLMDELHQGAALTFAGIDAGDLVAYIVYSTVFAATTAVTWWFGDRAFTPPGLKR